MPSLAFSGSIFPSPGTVHIVGTVAQAGVYVFKTDLGQMLNGDEVELRFADKPTIGTIALGFLGNYAHQQSKQIVYSQPVITSLGHVSLKMSAGSPRFFSYEVWSV